MSGLAKLRTHTEETKFKIRDKLSRSNNPFFGKKHTKESILKIIQSKSSVIYPCTAYNELMYIFKSVSELSRLINSNHATLNKFIESLPRALPGGRPQGSSSPGARDLFRGSWYITKELLNNNDLPLITDSNSLAYAELITDMLNSAHLKKAVFVFDLDNILLNKYDSVLDAKKDLNISHETIKKYVKSKKFIKININLVIII